MLIHFLAIWAIGTQASQLHGFDETRMHAAELLLTGNISRLVQEARSQNHEVKVGAIWALGQTGDAKHAQLLLDAARSPI